MSDTSQGPGWWMASDGKWYPPESAPAPPPVPPPIANDGIGSWGGNAYGPGYGAPPGQGGSPGYPGAYTPPAPNNSRATTSLVLGILSLTFCGIITGIFAIVEGTKAKREIAASGGTQGGAGMATAGLVMGWISVAMTGVAVLAIFAIAMLGEPASEKFVPIDRPGVCDNFDEWSYNDC